MRYYSFEVKFYVKDECKTLEETGIVAAENYAGAMTDIVDYYGEDDIEELTLSLLADTPLQVSKEAIKEIAEKVIW